MKNYPIPRWVLPACCLLIVAAVSKKHPLSSWEAAKDYVEVPAGFAYLEDQPLEVEAFYISRYEVSNQQYLAFLDELKARGQEDDYRAALPALQQAASWKKAPLKEGTMSPLYTAHQAFAQSPVMGVSYQAANAYCDWLSRKAEEETEGAYEIEFRLPTHAEWIRAARGETQSEYAWDSPYLQNEKGNYQCNFKRISAEKIRYNAESNTYEIVPPETYESVMLIDAVDAYEANAFGLYNVCGNVAEMIAEEGKAVGGSWNDTGYDVRVESVSDYAASSPYVGFRPVMVVRKR